jgi:hypothetical protein
MKKRFLALSLSMLFLGGMTMTGYAQINNTVTTTKVKDDDDKNKKKKTTKADCKTKTSCCNKDLVGKSCSDKKTKTDKKDGSKHK